MKIIVIATIGKVFESDSEPATVAALMFPQESLPSQFAVHSSSNKQLHSESLHDPEALQSRTPSRGLPPADQILEPTDRCEGVTDISLGVGMAFYIIATQYNYTR